MHKALYSALLSTSLTATFITPAGAYSPNMPRENMSCIEEAIEYTGIKVHNRAITRDGDYMVMERVSPEITASIIVGNPDGAGSMHFKGDHSLRLKAHLDIQKEGENNLTTRFEQSTLIGNSDEAIAEIIEYAPFIHRIGDNANASPPLTDHEINAASEWINNVNKTMTLVFTSCLSGGEYIYEADGGGIHQPDLKSLRLQRENQVQAHEAGLNL